MGKRMRLALVGLLAFGVAGCKPEVEAIDNGAAAELNAADVTIATDAPVADNAAVSNDAAANTIEANAATVNAR